LGTRPKILRKNNLAVHLATMKRQESLPIQAFRIGLKIKGDTIKSLTFRGQYTKILGYRLCLCMLQ